jgi:hypothetical protein
MFFLAGTNFEVTDCDLWSTWETFMTATLTNVKDDGSWIYFNVSGKKVFVLSLFPPPPTPFHRFTK